MESTSLASFLKFSKIKRWLSDPDLPPTLQEIKLLFNKIYTPDSTGNRNMEGADEYKNSYQKLSGNTIPCDLCPLLAQNYKSEVSLWARFKHQGIIFSTSQTHPGNSQIYFYPDGNTKLAPVAGLTEYIYVEQAKPGAISMAVQHVTPVNDDVCDPFLKYIHWPVRLYVSHPNLLCEQVHPDWIYCQFAWWNHNPKTMVIVFLNCVS